jgi:hypothetical protein
MEQKMVHTEEKVIESVTDTQNHHPQNSILAEFHEDFLAQAVSGTTGRIETKTASTTKLFKNYKYQVCAWPILIEKRTAARLGKLATRLPELLWKIPALYFENDQKRIADFYYNGNEIMAQFAMISHGMKLNPSIRLDISKAASGFKVLEVNAGSLMGGFELGSFENYFRKTHPRLNEKSPFSFKSYQVREHYFAFMVDEIIKYLPSVKNEVNLFIGLVDKEQKVRDNAMEFINTPIKAALEERGMRGGAFTGDLSEIKVVNGELRFRGIPIHAVTLLGENLTMPPAVYRSFLMKKVYLTAHFGYAILSNKRSLGILRELAEQGKFDAEDNQLVLEAIPFTKDVKAQQVRYKGETHDLLTLLKERKDEFIVKDPLGAKGNNVYCGRYESQSDWNKLVEGEAMERNYIAQEFCESINFLAPNANNNWVPHKLIWGAFGFGPDFGGVWGRLSDVSTDVGVINSDRGAVEAMMFEYDQDELTPKTS